MTQSWENPSFTASEVLPTSYEESVSVYENVPQTANKTDQEGIDVEPQTIMSEVLAITQAREAAAERKLMEDKLRAVDEINETVGTIVDWLAGLDYPGASIVDGLAGSVGSNGAIDGEQKIKIPLWPIGVSDWHFGPDKRLYARKTFRYLYGRHYENYICYVPRDITYDSGQVFTVRDALNGFDLPTEDSLLQ
jgi:hypothetical protein